MRARPIVLLSCALSMNALAAGSKATARVDGEGPALIAEAPGPDSAVRTGPDSEAHSAVRLDGDNPSPTAEELGADSVVLTGLTAEAHSAVRLDGDNPSLTAQEHAADSAVRTGPVAEAHSAARPDGDSHTLTAEELAAVPSVITGFTAALPLLPGTATWLSPLSLAGLRGGQPAATAWLFDGVRLPAAAHVLVGPPSLQDAAVESLTLHTRAAPISHGRSLAGAVVLDPAVRREPGIGADLSLDLLRAGALSHFVSKSGDTVATVGASAAWTPWLVSRTVGASAPSWDPSRRALRADLADYQARVEHALNDRARVRLLSLGSLDAAGTTSDTDLLGAALSWHRVDLRIELDAGPGRASAGLTYGHDTLGAELGGPVSQLEARMTQQTFAARAEWRQQLAEGTTVGVGGDVSRLSARLRQRWQVTSPVIEGAPVGEPIEVEAHSPAGEALLSGAWVELAHVVPQRWGATIGIRADDYHLVPGLDFVAIEPRLSAFADLTSQLRLSGGAALVHQLPTFFLPLPGVELSALRFGLQQALRTDASLSYRPNGTNELRVRGFFDPMTRTVELSPLDRNFLQAVKAGPEDVSARRGLAWGAELWFRHQRSDGWFGWLSATWQQSSREQAYAIRNDYGEPVGTGRATLPAAWEQNFIATALFGKSFGRWTFSGAGRFHTGVPEVGGLSSTTQREGLDRLRPGAKWIEADLIDAARLPPFFRLDARAAYRFDLERIDLRVTLDLQNLSFSREVWKFNYRETLDPASGAVTLERTASGSPVPGFPLPMLGLTARL